MQTWVHVAYLKLSNRDVLPGNVQRVRQNQNRALWTSINNSIRKSAKINILGHLEKSVVLQYTQG